MPSPAFEKAAEEVHNLASKPSNDDLLKLYALYKQATVGDNNTSKPKLDIKGRYKWQAWEDLKGMIPAEAETQYIAFVEELKTKC
ncbi:acyl-CoA-binding protein [Cokeromyces recurvatus]|uniref:acyl-CoA-binding protein n=1 Tax=Cokeromyces recurvatus TaxID=90255 RepID=UPI00221EF0C2|nr:acyl-CoA-binding protein [Cokeromyces recurvatus]KAI7907723.1 acyl-CoA-binding protein [Cokeromyces recurvatus]